MKAMTQHDRRFLAPLGAALLTLAACGGASVPAGTEQAVASEDGPWTRSQLRKLDPELRQRVQDGDIGRIAVKVFFLELPTESELSSLLLNRLGQQAIGQVEPEMLQRIAARRDVEHIEPLDDVGYEMP